MDIKNFWEAVIRQDAERIRPYFKETAWINWHCTNERFSVDEFIKANCEYPGRWDGMVERIERSGELITTVTKVVSKEGSLSFHAVSFIKIEDDKSPPLTNTGETMGPPLSGAWIKKLESPSAEARPPRPNRRVGTAICAGRINLPARCYFISSFVSTAAIARCKGLYSTRVRTKFPAQWTRSKGRPLIQ